MIINTNISAQNGAQLLAESSSSLAKSLARLSSGSKLISPEDDAAGLAVSMRFDAQISRLRAASSNVGNASAIISRLRSFVTGDISGLTGSLKRLDNLGFSSNGNDDSLDTSDTSQLDDVLANNLTGLKDLFTHSSSGLAVGAIESANVDRSLRRDGNCPIQYQPAIGVPPKNVHVVQAFHPRNRKERGVHAASPRSGQRGLEDIRVCEPADVEAG